MKRWSFGLAVLAMLVLALTLPAGAPAAPAPHHTPPAATAASHAKPPAAAPHPEIRDAMEALRQARSNLDHASHNFGGHRVAALKHIDEAMHELQTCMKYP